MLQCRIWGRGTGNTSEWEALTQGTQEKDRKICAPHLLRFSARFSSPELRGYLMVNYKLKRGQSVAWSDVGAKLCSVTSKRFWLELFRLHFTPSILLSAAATTDGPAQIDLGLVAQDPGLALGKCAQGRNS
jgi:hypothetical protein